MSKYLNDDFEKISRIFKALSNPNRVRIFTRLVDCCNPENSCCTVEEMSVCVGELGENLNIAPSTVSHHIKELNNAGLIHLKRSGQMIKCRVDLSILKEIKDFFAYDNLPVLEKK